MLVAVSIGGEETSTQPLVTTQPAAASRPAVPAEPTGDSAQATTTSAPWQVPVEGPIRLNFQNASLQAVLTYLSGAAGLVIVDAPYVEGRVTIISRQPVSIEEAVGLLDTVLRDKGYAAIHSGRTLKIVTLEQAKTSNIPVRAGSDPEHIEPSDRLVTHIIPVRYVDAVRLRTDLASLLPESADVAANEASNSLIITDSQANVRRIVEIVSALDQHMSGVAEVRVFQLMYADATNTARLITELFEPQDDRSSQRQRTSFRDRMLTMMRSRRGGGQPATNKSSKALLFDSAWSPRQMNGPTRWSSAPPQS